MKKKIKLKDWTYIGKYNHAAKWCRPFCDYTLSLKDSQTFEREQYVNLLAYIIMFIPLHILQILVLMWDGGLKEFEVFKRNLGKDVLSKGSPAYDRAREVFFS
jgi:hypothetical protein